MADEDVDEDVRDTDSAIVDEEAVVGQMVVGFDRVMLAEVQRAAERAYAAHADRDAPAGATAAAVLLAVAACEARLSEYVTAHESTLGEKTVKEIRDNPDGLHQWTNLLKAVAPRVDRSGRLYRDLGCLFDLRGVVAHRNARFSQPREWPEQLRECMRQHAIPALEAKGSEDWTSLVYVRDVAVWAHRVATDWLATAEANGIVVR